MLTRRLRIGRTSRLSAETAMEEPVESLAILRHDGPILLAHVVMTPGMISASTMMA